MKNQYYEVGEHIAIVLKFKGSEVLAYIDRSDFDIADSFRGTWSASQYKEGGAIYVTATDHNRGKPKSLKLHRIILGATEGVMVDHRNGEGLDNRRSNLRHATAAQNGQNRKSNGYRGVSYSKTKGKYRAHVTVEGKQKHLGYFTTAEEASEAAIEGRKIYFPFSTN